MRTAQISISCWPVYPTRLGDGHIWVNVHPLKRNPEKDISPNTVPSVMSHSPVESKVNLQITKVEAKVNKNIFMRRSFVGKSLTFMVGRMAIDFAASINDFSIFLRIWLQIRCALLELVSRHRSENVVYCTIQETVLCLESSLLPKNLTERSQLAWSGDIKKQIQTVVLINNY